MVSSTLKGGDHMIFSARGTGKADRQKGADFQRAIKQANAGVLDAHLKNDRAARDWLAARIGGVPRQVGDGGEGKSVVGPALADATENCRVPLTAEGHPDPGNAGRANGIRLARNLPSATRWVIGEIAIERAQKHRQNPSRPVLPGKKGNTKSHGAFCSR